MLIFMTGGAALCLTSVVLAWRVIARKLTSRTDGAGERQPQRMIDQ
jgi:hypothetical protein